MRSDDLYPHPSDIQINGWREGCWYLLEPLGVRSGDGLRDLVYVDSNAEVRRLLREGHQPVPQDAADFLIRLQGCDPAPGWGQEGVFAVTTEGAFTPLPHLSESEIVAAAAEGCLLTYDELRARIGDPVESVPASLQRSWGQARLDAQRRA